MSEKKLAVAIKADLGGLYDEAILDSEKIPQILIGRKLQKSLDWIISRS